MVTCLMEQGEFGLVSMLSNYFSVTEVLQMEAVTGTDGFGGVGIWGFVFCLVQQ